MSSPTFGKAKRDATQNEDLFRPNTEFEVKVNSSGLPERTVTLNLSITNLKEQFVQSTIEKVFNHALENVNNEMTNSVVSSPLPGTNNNPASLKSNYLIPVVHFEIDIIERQAKAQDINNQQGYSYYRLVNFDASIENIHYLSLPSTLARIKSYVTSALADMNPHE